MGAPHGKEGANINPLWRCRQGGGGEGGSGEGRMRRGAPRGLWSETQRKQHSPRALLFQLLSFLPWIRTSKFSEERGIKARRLINWGIEPNQMSSYDYSFKLLLVGDSGVGKSTFLVSFVSSAYSSPPHLNPTIGVDFKIKHLAIDGKRLKLTIWDTAGQERFGTLISSYYRGAHGIMLVYDVTNRQTFSNLTRQWAKEVELYSTEPQCVKILVANKLDREDERAVSREEGIALARELNCLFYECSARTGENVRHCFKDLTFKILEVPSLVEKGRAVVKKQQSAENQTQHTTNCCCIN